MTTETTQAVQNVKAGEATPAETQPPTPITLTREELIALIDERIDKRGQAMPPGFVAFVRNDKGQLVIDRRSLRPFSGVTEDGRTLKEVLESIERNRWTPPPGAPTSLQLLREDRDR
jgi:ABC-type sulfate transport system substrate-binding protein